VEKQFIMTAFGKDRPGIVAEIAKVIFEHKCNLEDSNMGRLADEFTMILLFTGKGDDLLEKMARDCKHLEKEKNIFVFIRPLEYQRLDTKAGNSFCTLEIEGIDQAGIVYKVSKLLAEYNINIETLKSQMKFSPHSGTAFYSMEIRAKIPDSVSMEKFNQSLDDLANELNIDINLK